MTYEVVPRWPASTVDKWDDGATVNRVLALARPECAMNQIVRENLEAIALTSITRGNVLDYGCGAGVYRPLLPAGMRYTGADASAPLIEHNRRSDRSGRYVLTPELPLPFEDDEFDLVFASGTMHLLEDWRLCVRELARVARGAVVLGRVPVVRSSPSFIISQTFRHAHGKQKHAMHVLRRADVADALRASGMLVKSWDYTAEIFYVLGAPEPVVMNTIVCAGDGRHDQDPCVSQS